MNENIWGIHAGRTGDAENLFLKQNCVAIGWAEMGDLRKLPPDRDSFKARMIQARPDGKQGAVPVNAGQLFRFLHEMKQGDVVAYPSKRERVIHIGTVEGDYIFDPTHSPTYPHRRPVRWSVAIPRNKFSQGALYEIGLNRPGFAGGSNS